MLQDFPLSTLSVKPGTDQKTSITMDVNLPYREGIEYDELYYLVTMKNSKGEVIGKKSGTIFIYIELNRILIKDLKAAVLKSGSYEEVADPYAIYTGTIPSVIARCNYNIIKPDAADWRIEIRKLEINDAKDSVIMVYDMNKDGWDGLKYTGDLGEMTTMKGFSPKTGSEPVPKGKGAKYAKLYAWLIDPAEGDIASENNLLLVCDDTKNEVKNVPQGSSSVSFDQVPLKLNFTSNSSAGKITVHEFQGQFPNNNSGSLAKSAASVLFTKFTPLNRYWSVYDDMKEDTYKASISFSYDPAKDFPFSPDFKEDSLVITCVNPNNGQLEARSSKFDNASHTITTDYLKFYKMYIVASKTGSATDVKRFSEIPDQFTLKQNYPNPFNPSTTISYSIAEPSKVVLKVYDLLGREISTLVSEYQNRGEYKIHFNASSLSSGVYIYTIHTSNFRESRKLLLTK